MPDQLISVVTTLIGALIGGALAVWGSVRSVREASRDLELPEIRRQKIECLASLSGLRFVMSQGQAQLDEYKSRLMFEMNRIPMLWSDDAATLKDLRDFYAERNNDRLLKLLRSMSKKTKFQLENLSDTDIRNIFLVELSNPAKIGSTK